jgi:hypothetical protein
MPFSQICCKLSPALKKKSLVLEGLANCIEREGCLRGIGNYKYEEIYYAT